MAFLVIAQGQFDYSHVGTASCYKILAIRPEICGTLEFPLAELFTSVSDERQQAQP